MRGAKVLCFVLALGVVVRAQAGTVIVFDTKGNITGSYVDQTTSYSYGKIQTETSGLLYQKMAARGWSVNSAQAITTIEAVESVAVSAASGARSGIGGGWIGMVAGAVIGAVVQGAIALGLDKLVSWLFGSNGQVTVGASGGSASGTGLSAGGSALIGSYNGHTLTAGGYSDFASYFFQNACSAYPTGPISECSVSSKQCSATAPQCVEIDTTLSYNDGRQPSQYTSPATTFNVNSGTWSGGSCSGIGVDGVCTPFGPTDTGASSTPKPVSVTSAVSQLPDAEKAQPVNPELMADTTDSLWQEASQQPGYQGVPYDPSDPITAADAAAWQNANPSFTPTVGDGVGSGAGAGTQGSTSGGGSVGSLPVSGRPGSQSSTAGANTPPSGSTGSSGNTSTTTVTGNPNGSTTTTVTTSSPACGAPGQPACEVDWGSYTGTAEPSLESPPTIAMILGPILNMLPGFKSFQVPAHTGACPIATFSLFGSTFTMDQHCTLFEQNRTAIGAAFAVMFLIASVFIVLTA